MATTPNTTNPNQALIDSLTAAISTLANEVTRTYNDYVTKTKAYENALAYEREIDRQRIEKISDNDAYNADILSSMLRNEVRPSRESAGVVKDNASASWESAKNQLSLAKQNLSALENTVIDNALTIGNNQSALEIQAGKQALDLGKSTAEQAAADLAAKEKTRKTTNIIIYAVVGVVVVVGVAFVYVKYIKNKKS